MLDDAGTTLAVTVSGTTADARLDGADIVVATIPQGAPVGPAELAVDVDQKFPAMSCSAIACEDGSFFQWRGTVSIVIE